MELALTWHLRSIGVWRSEHTDGVTALKFFFVDTQFKHLLLHDTGGCMLFLNSRRICCLLVGEEALLHIRDIHFERMNLEVC